MTKDEPKPTDLEEGGQAAEGGFMSKIGHILKSSALVVFFVAVVGLESPTSKARASTTAIHQFEGKPSEIWISFVMTVVMLVFCLTASIIKYGPKSLKQIYSKQQVLDFIPFAVCFAFCNAPKSISANFLSAELAKVLTSMKTVFAALVFGFTKVHRYSLVQKLFLFLITAGVITYVITDVQVKDTMSEEKLKLQNQMISEWQTQFQGQTTSFVEMQKDPINANLFAKTGANGALEFKAQLKKDFEYEVRGEKLGEYKDGKQSVSFEKDQKLKKDPVVVNNQFTWQLDPRIVGCMQKGQKIPIKEMNAHIRANGGWSIPSKEMPLLTDQDPKKEPKYRKLKEGKVSEKPFYWEGCKEDSSGSQLFVGLALIAIHLALHAWGSWFGEKALKKGKNVPYLMQKATEMSIALVLSVLPQLFLIYPFVPKDKWIQEGSGKGLLHDLHDNAVYEGRMWDGWATVGLWSYFIVLFTRHFVAGIIVKNLNTIVKQVASNGSLIIVYFVGMWWAGIESPPFGITREYKPSEQGPEFKKNDSEYDLYYNKYGIAYTDKHAFIKGSTQFNITLFTVLILVTGICLGWAIVSKYTKCKNNWKKLYLELKESEDAINAEEPTSFPVEQGTEQEQAPLVGEGSTPAQ